MGTIKRRSPVNSLSPDWITGLVDGEGSFVILFSPNRKFKTGWEVRPSFALSLNKKNRGILFRLRDYFGCGTIRPCRRDHTYKYEVRSLTDLKEKVIPHFLKHPLVIKRKEFKVFDQVIQLMARGDHLKPAGLKKIAALVREINWGDRKVNFPQFDR